MRGKRDFAVMVSAGVAPAIAMMVPGTSTADGRLDELVLYIDSRATDCERHTAGSFVLRLFPCSVMVTKHFAMVTSDHDHHVGQPAWRIIIEPIHKSVGHVIYILHHSCV